MLQVALAPKAVAALDRLNDDDRMLVIAALRRLPAAFGRPHAHTGIGLRQLRSGLYEARIGLSLRAVFARLGDHLDVRLIGSHDEVRRFLKA
jgi:mRNA-degrading endonuclease RelE of RelBE toxin-antitoxin system